MKKSSQAEFVYRINTALSAYRDATSSLGAISILTKQFNVSKRQAYRYLQEALKANGEQAIPETKAVFTVKLAKSQIKELRGYAKKSDVQLSALLGGIIDAFLKTKKKDG